MKYMKTLLCFAAFAALITAQDKKPAAEPPQAIAAPTERPFTEDEVAKLSLAQSQMQVLRDRFHIDDLEKTFRDFQAEASVIAARQEAVVRAACLSIGVPEAQIKTGVCQPTFGIDATGKPIMGQDGKPVPNVVRRVPQQGQTPVLPAADKK